MAKMGSPDSLADEALTAAVAAAIRAALRDNDRNIAWLATKVDIPYSTLYGQLTRRPESITFATVVRIAAALDVDPSRFIPAGVLA